MQKQRKFAKHNPLEYSRGMKKDPTWNLRLLYESPDDPQIEADMKEIEEMSADFARTYDTPEKKYLSDETTLHKALTIYEKLVSFLECKPALYCWFIKDTDSTNMKAVSMSQLISARQAKAVNKIIFFEVSLGTVSVNKQASLLKSKKLAHFKVFLKRIFDDAKHVLSVPEEKILNLKSLPGEQMWVDGNERLLNKRTVTWKGKKLALSEALQKIHDTPNSKERYKLDALVSAELKAGADFAEAEVNAVYTDKKINDELRGYKEPFDQTVEKYRNDPRVVEQLAKTVTEAFPIAHRFYKIKAKLLKLKKLKYADRKISIGTVKTKFPFDKSITYFKKSIDEIDPKYSVMMDAYLKNGQLDVPPRTGKTSGAYCASSYLNPTFVLLNHTGTFNSFSTLAHEMGHAFHGELSQSQGPIYSQYSTSLAETASTLFEAIAVDAVTETLPENEKIIALHDRVSDSIATVFRQIACFNFELELHNTLRTKGFVSKEEIAELHNKNMKAYLGPQFEMTPNDGFFFVTWSHIRRFFYVYSYAYGQLVSSALLRRYRENKGFWKSIEKFLSAGGKASPEEILMEIGVDVSTPEFWKEGLRAIEDDIVKLERLVKGK